MAYASWRLVFHVLARLLHDCSGFPGVAFVVLEFCCRWPFWLICLMIKGSFNGIEINYTNWKTSINITQKLKHFFDTGGMFSLVLQSSQ